MADRGNVPEGSVGLEEPSGGACHSAGVLQGSGGFLNGEMDVLGRWTLLRM